MSANKSSPSRIALRASLSASTPPSLTLRARFRIIRARARVRVASLACAAALASLAALAPTQARAALSGLERLFTGPGQVTAVEFAPGDNDRIFVASRFGEIRIYHRSTNTLDPTPFITIPNLDFEVEGGLLGLTFDPNYQTNGKFYVNVTVDNGDIPLDDETTSPFSTHIRQYSVSANPNIANSAFNEIDQWIQPQAWHNGGWMHFGPDDGYLYLLTGDGGAAFDIGPGHTPGSGNAQDLSDNRLGKLLRIDTRGDDFPLDPLRNYAIPPDNPFVDDDAADDEIFAYGLRSPWRASFDRATGDLWIGDVGEGLREEIDLLPAGTTGGQNYGWNKREGSQASPVGGPLPGAIEPIYDYEHTSAPGDPAFEGNSVTGGYRYRGSDPSLQGKYIFADFVASRLWMFNPDDLANGYEVVENITDQLPASSGSANYFTTFSEDEVGNLYVATIDGSVFRIVTDEVTPGDFHLDAAVDIHDLSVWRSALGTTSDAADADGDGDSDGDDFLLWQQNLGWSALTPPPPVKPGDFERDDDVDLDDLAVWREALGTTSDAADANGDGASDGKDFLIWQQNLGWNVTPPAPVKPGDFERDDDVDIDDLTVWQTALGTTSAGDANGDGVSDGADFLLWQQNLSGSALDGQHAVPEPPASLLLALALTGAAGLARRVSF